MPLAIHFARCAPTLTAAFLTVGCGSDAGVFAIQGGGAQAGAGSGAGASGATGGGSACAPGESESCYSGPVGTVDVGECRAGVRSCLPEGSGFGPCEGEITPGLDDCATVEDEDCDGTAFPCTGTHLSSRKFDHAVPYAVATDAQGRVALAGGMFGPQDFGNGPLSPGGQSDVFATVYDVNDAIVFARSFGNDAFEQANGIALDGLGGVVVVGEFVNGIDFGGGPLTSGDSFIVRLDASGNHVWSKAVVPGIESRAFAVAIDSAGAVYVTGELTGGADFGGGFLPGAGNRDVFVVKLDASGSHQWSHLYGDGDHQSGMSITVDGTGNAYVAGYFNGAIGFGGPTLSNPPNPGGTDGFLVKLDTGGGHVWTKHFGASGNQAAIAVSSDASGNVAVTGAQEGSVDYGGGPLSASGSDVFVVRYQPNGTHAWSTIFGDAAEQVGRGIAMDGTSSVIVVGDFFGMIDFGGSTLASAGDRDVFLAKLSSTGQHAWSQGFGDPAIQQGLAVAAEGGGRIALAGHFSGVIQFGGSTLTANTVAGFVARFAP